MTETQPPTPLAVGERQAIAREKLLSGVGYVFFNPDTGEEYAPNHPVESGEVPDAQRVRRSTPQEDVLYQAYQAIWRDNVAPQTADAILSLDSPSLGEGVRITDDLIAIGAKQMRAVVEEGGWDDETILGSALEAMGLSDGVKVATPTTNAPVADREGVEAWADLQSHRLAWRSALVKCAERCALAGDEVDQSYWNHEIAAFDRTLASLTKNVATNADMRGDEKRSFVLCWIAAARPPAHPEPMLGIREFCTFAEAIAFMNKQAADARFESLTERAVSTFDRSGAARTVLQGDQS